MIQRIEKTWRKRKYPHTPVCWALREALSIVRSEAALRHRPEMLAELEPEVRGASRKMYDRLVAHRE